FQGTAASRKSDATTTLATAGDKHRDNANPAGTRSVSQTDGDLPDLNPETKKPTQAITPDDDRNLTIPTVETKNIAAAEISPDAQKNMPAEATMPRSQPPAPQDQSGASAIVTASAISESEQKNEHSTQSDQT